MNRIILFSEDSLQDSFNQEILMYRLTIIFSYICNKLIIFIKFDETNKVLSIFLFLGFVFNSCSSSESDDEPARGEEITSITLSSNTTSTYVGETVTFTVMEILVPI